MSQLTSIAVLAVAGAVTLSAQTRPDLSGRWTPVGRTDGSPALVIVQDATSLVGEIDDRSRERMRYTFTGTTLQEVSHHDIEVASTASWKDATLQTTSTFRTKSTGTTLSVREEAWSLDAEGRLVIEVTTRRSSGQTSTTRQLYKRSGG